MTADDGFVTLGNGVTFECGNGGIVTMLNTAYLTEFGLDDGWVYYDDLRINAHADIIVDLSPPGDVTSGIRHTNGESIMEFDLTARVPNGTADIRFTNLQSEDWYKFLIDDKLARTVSGRAHDQATPDGVLQFNSVSIPQ